MTPEQYKERNAKGFEGDHFIEQEIKALCEKHGINFIFELGAMYGATANRLSQFANVVSCEIDQNNFNEATKNASSRALILKCSSEELLEKNLPNMVNNKLLIYIDSHSWQQPTPLLKELDLIAKSGLKPVIAIHDWKVPGRPELGFDSYGGQDYTWDWILPSVEKIYGNGFTYHYNGEATGAMRGIVYIEPITHTIMHAVDTDTIKEKKKRKPKTEEQKKAASEKMKASWAKRNATN